MYFLVSKSANKRELLTMQFSNKHAGSRLAIWLKDFARSTESANLGWKR